MDTDLRQIYNTFESTLKRGSYVGLCRNASGFTNLLKRLTAWGLCGVDHSNLLFDLFIKKQTKQQQPKNNKKQQQLVKAFRSTKL